MSPPRRPRRGPSLPTRFPYWCRAIYSWGGESKHDLGFIQGDVIECLNAGDGSCVQLQRDLEKMIPGGRL
ncbi:hypothetical protein BHE90_016571 [Fusarium euwallaceae]|uniref:SH3 domain-containing protein n=1 Tax=Fusarium euwallaceae TaxID=1147111 RepID=A0A430L035_9HYPO|nr:hypothetical protein BHE90_016571 [Fusarium euwallaceae]